MDIRKYLVGRARPTDEELEGMAQKLLEVGFLERGPCPYAGTEGHDPDCDGGVRMTDEGKLACFTLATIVERAVRRQTEPHSELVRRVLEFEVQTNETKVINVEELPPSQRDAIRSMIDKIVAEDSGDGIDWDKMSPELRESARRLMSQITGVPQDDVKVMKAGVGEPPRDE